MRAFVTGGSGFIGQRIIRRLIHDGHSVLALARSQSSMEKVKNLGAEPLAGELSNISTWKSSLVGCDGIVHCAAPVEFWGDWQTFYQGIVVATKSLFSSATEAGVKKFVHLSSESVLQDKTPLLDVDETYPYPRKPNSHYGAAKKQAEIDLLETQSPTEVIILRPPFVWGNGSSALYEIGMRAKSNSFLWASRGQAPFEAVHVENLAEAALLALKKTRANKAIYFVTDDELATTYDFFSAYFDAIGVKTPRFSLPNKVIQITAWIAEHLWRTFPQQSKPPLTTFEWAFIGMPRRYKITKAQTDLGYKPIVSRSQGFRTIGWT